MEWALSYYPKGSTYNQDGVMDMFLRDTNFKELKEDQRTKGMEGEGEEPLHEQYPRKTEETESISWRKLKTGYLSVYVWVVLFGLFL